ncbi:heme A synthase [Alkalihalophilus pseudofirmus]|uniref:Heme A synthase n=1 Tax=Alkalihalophilus pseudofirmus TaxID=79885 RepID=A0AAJ2U1C9_ALKPS|nr:MULTISPECIES: heme A synthase [Alkalihalophilus]MDV2885417.1 heme A synthase [Alkalihalophilus pseudofirmus]MED1602144.1 heme A synthase [Alkalihalophilus marmarensis]OLS37345.1 heme A synthase [Alkalihalophilus pseudofirmus]
MHKRLKIYSVITSIGVLIVLLQGALVTKTGSGEGCGATWPLCFGEVIPTNPAIETIIEYSHRIVSGLVGAMIIILAIWAWKQLKHMREAKALSIAAVILIIFQGLLGAGAVVFGQSKAILALHFGISAMSLAAVVLLTILAFEDGREHTMAPKVSRGFKYYVFFVITYCYAVIYSGAYVKHSEATLACAGFPLCNGQIFPGLYGPIGAHYFHRVVGTILLLFLLILMIWTLSRYRHYRVLTWTAVLSFLLVVGQFISGISIVFTQNALSVGLIHALIISILFSALSYMTMIITRPSH